MENKLQWDIIIFRFLTKDVNQMKVVIIGGTGTIGTAVAHELEKENEVLVVGHNSGEFQCDIASSDSITKLYKKLGFFDALVCTAGKIQFAEFSKMSEKDFYVGLNNKLMGQVNLVRIGCEYIADKGSFTLTSGILSCDPIKAGSSASMVNAAINGFVIGAAIELPRGIRINVVSPTIIEESWDKYGTFFKGYESVSASKAAMAYSKSVHGLQTGKIYKVGYL